MASTEYVNATRANGAWLLPDFDGILPEMKAVPNWVLADKNKVPFQPSGMVASSTDPATWSAFDGVRQAYDPRRYIGVGFVLDGQPHFNGKYLHGFDWDKCVEDGRLDPAVRASIMQLAIGRLEISVSGTGLRGFFLHDQPLPSRRTKVDGRSVELYSNARYMITTGRAYKGCEALA